MQKKTVHPRLTTNEKALVENYFHLLGWQFDEIIKVNCTKMTTHWIESDEYAVIYGLKAIKADTKESCIANYFVRYESRLYQASCLETILSIVKALKVEAKVSEYWSNFYKKRNEEREKIRNQKQRLRVKKLETFVKKVA